MYTVIVITGRRRRRRCNSYIQGLFSGVALGAARIGFLGSLGLAENAAKSTSGDLGRRWVKGRLDPHGSEPSATAVR